MLVRFDVSCSSGSNPRDNVYVVLPLSYVRSDESGRKFDYSSSDDSELILGKARHPKLV